MGKNSLAASWYTKQWFWLISTKKTLLAWLKSFAKIVAAQELCLLYNFVNSHDICDTLPVTRESSFLNRVHANCFFQPAISMNFLSSDMCEIFIINV